MVKSSDNSKPKKAKLKDNILLHFTERNRKDGSVIESTQGGDPKEFTLGNDELNKSLEVHIVGMREGESKTVVLPANKAYGSYKQKYVFEVEKDKLNSNQNLSIGDPLVIKLKNGKKLSARLVKENGDRVVLDANHVLAGNDIEYDLKLLKIIRP